MLRLLADEGPQPRSAMLLAGQEQVSWNEATNAYAVEHVYRKNHARKNGKPDPAEVTDLHGRANRGRRYLVAKLWDQIKSRKLIQPVEQVGLVVEGDPILFEITEKGLVALANPSPVPYMRFALQGRQNPRDYPIANPTPNRRPAMSPEERAERQRVAKQKYRDKKKPTPAPEPEPQPPIVTHPGPMPDPPSLNMIDQAVEWDYERGEWHVKRN